MASTGAQQEAELKAQRLTESLGHCKEQLDIAEAQRQRLQTAIAVGQHGCAGRFEQPMMILKVWLLYWESGLKLNSKIKAASSQSSPLSNVVDRLMQWLAHMPPGIAVCRSCMQGMYVRILL